MNELKDRYRRQRAPAALAAELEREFGRRRHPSRWVGMAAAAASVILVAALFWLDVPQGYDTDGEQYAAVNEPPTELSPVALTARTSSFGQLSVSRLSLPANPNLTGVTSLPALPPAPLPPATL